MNARLSIALLGAAVIVAGCGGSGSMAPTAAIPQLQGSLPTSETVGSGEINGVDNQFSPTDGDTSSGGRGQTVDGVPCIATMSNEYHVHVFLGMLINGRQIALSDGDGMKNPGADATYLGIPNWTENASCYYYLHTHDASGVIHIEAPKSASVETSLYTLGNFFDIWGMTLSSTRIGPFSGTVRTYVAQVPVNTTQVTPSMYKSYSYSPRSIPLKSHTAIWLEIGPTYVSPSSFPVIRFYEEY
jgi:hypothetical protein